MTNNNHQNHQRDGDSFKILLLGSEAVGKTSIVQRYVYKVFKESYHSTLGLDILYKEVDFKNSNYNLTIWDFGGQDCFKQIRKRFYGDSDGIVLIFSLSDESSLDRLERWIAETETQITARVPLVIAANKKDLLEERTVATKSIVEFLEKHDLTASFFYTSAKTGENIHKLFYRIVELIIEHQKTSQ